MKSASSALKNRILRLRKERRLHPEVARRLSQLMDAVAPEFIPVTEPQGLAGGRNDLILFDYRGKKILFEVFATRSQVSRDLRILDKTKAHFKIAVLIDPAIDRSVRDAYLRENPEDPYPFLFIGELLQEPIFPTYLKLRELIFKEEDARIRRLAAAAIESTDFARFCRREGIKILTRRDLETRRITLQKAFVTTVMQQLRSLGLPLHSLRTLGKWLSQDNLIRFVLTQHSYGMNLYLYTDLVEHFAVYNDVDLHDWILVGKEFPRGLVLLSITGLLERLLPAFMPRRGEARHRNELRFFLGKSTVIETDAGREVILNLPSKLAGVHLIPPQDMLKTPSKDILAKVHVLEFDPQQGETAA